MQSQGNSSIKVFVRVRPLVPLQRETQQVVEVLSDNKTVKVTTDQYNQLQIKFDQAFNPKSSQGDVYSILVDVIPKIIEGYNVTIFAYGQTGSGKTHTMFGQGWENEQKIDIDQIETEDGSAGVIPRSIYQLFQKISKVNQAHLYCSFLQIYNQKIYDLLQDSETPKPLSIHQSKTQGIFVEGLTQFGVQKFQDCLQLLRRGVKNRTIRQTSMNAKSSRSHTIFQLLLQIEDKNGSFLKGRLNLCDLAGSQKINKKQAMTEVQLKQLKNINLSLTTLGKVIFALSSGDKKAVAAFRQSKLTRLLQQSLTGNTYTFIFGNLSPSSKNIEETINTLKFVERANHITLKVKPTEYNRQNPDSVAKLQKQVEYLKDLLNLKKQGINPEQMIEQLNALKHSKEKSKTRETSNQQLQKLIRENRQMKKQINELQVKLSRSQATEISQNSQYMMQLRKQKIDYYQPSKREPSSRRSSQLSSSKQSNSLLQAGQSIAFQKDSIQDHPNRAKEKQMIAKKLQELQEKKRYNEHKLINDYEQQYKRRNKNSPSLKHMPASSAKPAKKDALIKKEEPIVIPRPRKKVDYSDKIKELQARLFGK